MRRQFPKLPMDDRSSCDTNVDNDTAITSIDSEELPKGIDNSNNAAGICVHYYYE